MLAQPELFVRTLPIIRVDYFDKKLQSTVKFIIEYSQKYSTVPTIEQLRVNTNVEVLVMDQDQATQNQTWFFDEFEKFCKQRAIEQAILKGTDLLRNGNFDEIETLVKEAVLVGLQRDLGINYWENPKERLQRLLTSTGNLSTGWQSLDYMLFGGFGIGELEIFCAPPNGGKSIALQNLALNYASQNKNVVLITLEMGQDQSGKRMDSMVSDVPSREIYKKMDEVDLKVVMEGKRSGKLQIKKLPEGGTTTTDIKAYIKEYEIQTKSRVDILLVDYLDLLYPTRKVSLDNIFLKDKYVCEELRGYASEKGFLIITASQLNRDSIGEMDFNQGMIAGGISKINTADNVIAIFSSLPMRERGQMEFQLLKTRNSDGLNKKLIMSYNPLTLRIKDDPNWEDVVKNKKISTISTRPVHKIEVDDNDKNDNANDDKPIFDRSSVGESLVAERIRKPATIESLLDKIKKRNS